MARFLSLGEQSFLSEAEAGYPALPAGTRIRHQVGAPHERSVYHYIVQSSAMGVQSNEIDPLYELVNEADGDVLRFPVEEVHRDCDLINAADDGSHVRVELRYPPIAAMRRRIEERRATLRRALNSSTSILAVLSAGAVECIRVQLNDAATADERDAVGASSGFERTAARTVKSMPSNFIPVGRGQFLIPPRDGSAPSVSAARAAAPSISRTTLLEESVEPPTLTPWQQRVVSFLDRQPGASLKCIQADLKTNGYTGVSQKMLKSFLASKKGGQERAARRRNSPSFSASAGQPMKAASLHPPSSSSSASGPLQPQGPHRATSTVDEKTADVAPNGVPSHVRQTRGLDNVAAYREAERLARQPTEDDMLDVSIACIALEEQETLSDALGLWAKMDQMPGLSAGAPASLRNVIDRIIRAAQTLQNRTAFKYLTSEFADSYFAHPDHRLGSLGIGPRDHYMMPHASPDARLRLVAENWPVGFEDYFRGLVNFVKGLCVFDGTLFRSVPNAGIENDEISDEEYDQRRRNGLRLAIDHFQRCAELQRFTASSQAVLPRLISVCACLPPSEEAERILQLLRVRSLIWVDLRAAANAKVQLSTTASSSPPRYSPGSVLSVSLDQVRATYIVVLLEIGMLFQRTCRLLEARRHYGLARDQCRLLRKSSTNVVAAANATSSELRLELEESWVLAELRDLPGSDACLDRLDARERSWEAGCVVQGTSSWTPGGDAAEEKLQLTVPRRIVWQRLRNMLDRSASSGRGGGGGAGGGSCEKEALALCRDLKQTVIRMSGGREIPCDTGLPERYVELARVWVKMRGGGLWSSCRSTGAPPTAGGGGRLLSDSALACEQGSTFRKRFAAPLAHRAFEELRLQVLALDSQRRGRTEDARTYWRALLENTGWTPVIAFHLLTCFEDDVDHKPKPEHTGTNHRAMETLAKLREDYPYEMKNHEFLALLYLENELTHCSGAADGVLARLNCLQTAMGFARGSREAELVAYANLKQARDWHDCGEAARATDLLQNCQDLPEGRAFLELLTGVGAGFGGEDEEEPSDSEFVPCRGGGESETEEDGHCPDRAGRVPLPSGVAPHEQDRRKKKRDTKEEVVTGTTLSCSAETQFLLEVEALEMDLTSVDWSDEAAITAHFAAYVGRQVARRRPVLDVVGRVVDEEPGDLFEWEIPSSSSQRKKGHAKEKFVFHKTSPSEGAAGAGGFRGDGVVRFGGNYGRGRYFGVVHRSLKTARKNEYHRALAAKGFAARRERANGVKFDPPLVKIKISGDHRAWTDRIYRNRHGNYLMVFDHEDDHLGVRRAKEGRGRRIERIDLE